MMPPEANGRRAWWPGPRGEGYVVLQFALIALVLLGPSTIGTAAWPAPIAPWLRATGLFGIAAGTLLAGLAGRQIWALLTPLPDPKPGGHLVLSGPYRFVRHPIYGGLVIMAFGYACAFGGWLTLGYVLLFCWLVTAKIRFEERRLGAAYPGYAEYRRRTRRLIPFLY